MKHTHNPTRATRSRMSELITRAHDALTSEHTYALAMTVLASSLLALFAFGVITSPVGNATMGERATIAIFIAFVIALIVGTVWYWHGMNVASENAHDAYATVRDTLNARDIALTKREYERDVMREQRDALADVLARVLDERDSNDERDAVRDDIAEHLPQVDARKWSDASAYGGARECDANSIGSACVQVLREERRARMNK